MSKKILIISECFYPEEFKINDIAIDWQNKGFQMGKQDVVFAGGSEEVHWAMTAMFDAMTALSSKYNDVPETASRAYDKTRDGFVIAGGAGVLVLEEYEHAKSRGAKIYAELTG